MVTMDVFEIEFHAWSIAFLWKNGLFIGENYNAKERMQNLYTVAIVKRTAGCTEDQDSWPQAD